MILKLITYNIQRGIAFDSLFSHFTSIPEFQQADVIAVQEACIPENGENTLSRLFRGFPKGYRWSYRKVMTYPDKEYGNGFIFKENWVPMAEEVIPLPRVSRLKWYEKQKTEGGAPDTKSAFVQTFRVTPQPDPSLPFPSREGEEGLRNYLIRITNVHMDFAGGSLHRQAQLQHILKFLNSQQKVDVDIICGDLNTIGKFCSPKAQKNRRSVLEVALNQGYIDCSETIDWTSDLFSHIDPDDPARHFLTLCKFLGLHFRQKTDHILAKGIKSIHRAKKVTLPHTSHLPGSDHVPVYVELEV